ncbi:hypothetical protein TNCV_103581 [Trichonephila clavipes]|nr:hypothetical protein TNCV_103581 [Trichonephila clavipes]
MNSYGHIEKKVILQEELIGIGSNGDLKGLGSNPRENMDVCKCRVPARHAGTLNSRRAASPLVRLVEVEERWEAPDPLPPRVFSLKLGWNRVKSYCPLSGAQGYGQRQAYI